MISSYRLRHFFQIELLNSENNWLKSLVEVERQQADKANQLLSESREGTLVLKCEMETQHVLSERRVTDLQMQLDKVWQSSAVYSLSTCSKTTFYLSGLEQIGYLKWLFY